MTALDYNFAAVAGKANNVNKQTAVSSSQSCWRKNPWKIPDFFFEQIKDLKARAERNPKKNIWPARQTMLTSKRIKVRALSGSQNCFEKHHQA